MLETASIETLRVIDNWALLMTAFIVMNPDQQYLFEFDIKEQHNTKKQTNQLNLLHQHLKEKLFSSHSPSNLSMQASYLEKISEVFTKVVSFIHEERKTVHCWKSLLENEVHIFRYLYLSSNLPHEGNMTKEKLVVDLTFRLCLNQTMKQQMQAAFFVFRHDRSFFFRTLTNLQYCTICKSWSEDYSQFFKSSESSSRSKHDA